MAVSHRNGIALTALSHFNGIAKASVSAIGGIATGGGGGGMTLKASGIATQAVFILTVDGSTVKEWVNSGVNTNKTVGAAVSVASGSWKGTTRSYFQTEASATGGIVFGASNRPLCNNASISIFMAAQDVADASFLAGAILDFEGTGGSADPRWGRSHDDNHIALRMSSAYRVIGSVQPATNTKFSAGNVIGTGANSHYALEATAGSARTTTSDAADTAYVLNHSLHKIGGGATDMTAGKFYLVAAFNGALASGDWEALHNEPFTTLFDGA
jgi:hypothetical protein